jgi:hypothetical protein
MYSAQVSNDSNYAFIWQAPVVEAQLALIMLSKSVILEQAIAITIETMIGQFQISQSSVQNNNIWFGIARQIHIAACFQSHSRTFYAHFSNIS